MNKLFSAYLGNPVPQYMVDLVYQEAHCHETFKANETLFNKIKYEIIHRIAKKIFTVWYQFERKKTIQKLLEDYITKLIVNCEKHRQCYRVGEIEVSRVKYEAGQSAIFTLLKLYNTMMLGSVVCV